MKMRPGHPYLGHDRRCLPPRGGDSSVRRHSRTVFDRLYEPENEIVDLWRSFFAARNQGICWISIILNFLSDRSCLRTSNNGGIFNCRKPLSGLVYPPYPHPARVKPWYCQPTHFETLPTFVRMHNNSIAQVRDCVIKVEEGQCATLKPGGP